MAIVTGDRYLEKLVEFIEGQTGPLLEGSLVLKLNPAGLHYVQSRLEALNELESLLAGTPVDYLRAYVSDLGDHRALEQLRRILRLLPSLKVVSTLPPPSRDPTPLSLRPFGRLRILELRGCDLSATAARGLLELRHTLEKLICYNSTVSCRIGKLVLRNNALTTLHGIENLKSLEGLDVSYNIISNFSEIEFLVCLPSLRSLWLEGNPLCCARWYRVQVFSYFTHLDKLKLDDKHISNREYWKRQIIIASRQKRPATFGFYSPAKDEAKEEGGNINQKRRKASRLVFLENEEENTCMYSDPESVLCDAEIRSREESVLSDAEAEIADLMNRVELMKKERSIFWLREFRVWMDHASENFVEITKPTEQTMHNEKENYRKKKSSKRYLGDSSRYVSDSVLASGDDSSTNILESDNSLADMSIGLPANQFFTQVSSLGNSGRVFLAGGIDLKEEHQQFTSSHSDVFAIQGAHGVVENVIISPLSAIDGISESHLSSAYVGSPPHYQEGILHRRHTLVKEILQLSADSYSVASSDSNTSCSDDAFCESTSAVDKSLNESYLRNIEEHSSSIDFEDKGFDQRHEIPHVRENGISYSCDDQTSRMQKSPNLEQFHHSQSNKFPAAATLDDGLSQFFNQEADYLEKRKGKRKSKKKVIPLEGENNVVSKKELFFKSNGNLDICGAEQTSTNAIVTPATDDAHKFPGSRCASLGDDGFVENYFNANIADSSMHETCQRYMCCDCVLEPQSKYRERCREVGLVLSSENKLYVLFIGLAGDQSGTIISLAGCHKVEDIREVSVGLGLQVVRLYIDRDSEYLFITRSIEKSRQLFSTFKVFDSSVANDNCSLQSLEQVQVELFEKQICGGSKVNLYQYSMVLFWCNHNGEDIWLSRSLFVMGMHLLVCVEDLMHFSSLSVDSSWPPYFSLDSCCSIVNLSEMVIEARERLCVTLALKRDASEFSSSAKAGKAASNYEKTRPSSVTWKLRWFSIESLCNFVALVKAIHAGTSLSPLHVRCIP
ncbi:hypothetical protein I3760_15G127000 [Carya illinoinensis]|nr:hypothetical protein I3760_15G127000 [Carya illinoinensis]